MSVFQLAYVSATKTPMPASKIAKILDVSQQNNIRDNVTGVLLYGNQMFFQILEGVESVVKSTFSRIRNDTRHYGATVTLEMSRRKRNFSSWSMGYGGVEHNGILNALPILDHPLPSNPTARDGKTDLIALRLAQYFFHELENASRS